MPPVFIQPGLGESLNRYLERLGRRGEEQRRLTAQRDNLQARMDARAAEVRTRMISQSINQTVGLFTDEMQRDRASQRRLGEAEHMQYLKGLPAERAANAELGLTNFWDSELSFVDKKAGIGPIKARLLARIHDSPNTLGEGEGRRFAESKAWLQQFAKQFAADELTQSDYVTGTMQALANLDFEPSGPRKQTIPMGRVVFGTGRKSAENPNGNDFPIGYRVQWNEKAQKFEDFPGEEQRREQNEQLWADSLLTVNPELTRWEAMTKEDRAKAEAEGKTEPSDQMTMEERQGWVIRERDLRTQTLHAANKDADDAHIAKAQLPFAAVADPSAGGGLQPGGGTPATAFVGLPNKKLDALVKEAGRPLVMQDEQGQDVIVPNKDGEPCFLFYMGNGEVERVPVQMRQKMPPNFFAGVGKGVGKVIGKATKAVRP